MDNELNIQITNLESLEEIKRDDARYHYLFPMVLAGKHSFQAHTLRSFQLDLRGRIEVISSPTQFFPRARDLAEDVEGRLRVNVQAKYFYSKIEEEFNAIRKQEKLVEKDHSQLASMMSALLFESVEFSGLSDFWIGMEEAKEEPLQRKTATEVVSLMHKNLLEHEEKGAIVEEVLLKDLQAFVDPTASRRFEEGVHYFWEGYDQLARIIMVNASFDYLVWLYAKDLLY